MSSSKYRVKDSNNGGGGKAPQNKIFSKGAKEAVTPYGKANAAAAPEVKPVYLNCTLAGLAAIIREKVDVVDRPRSNEGKGLVLDLRVRDGPDQGKPLVIMVEIGTPELPVWLPSGVRLEENDGKESYKMAIGLPKEPYRWMTDEEKENFTDIYNLQMKEAEVEIVALVKRRWKAWGKNLFEEEPTDKELARKLRFYSEPAEPPITENDDWKKNAPRIKANVDPEKIHNKINEKGKRTNKFLSIKEFKYSQRTGNPVYVPFDPDYDEEFTDKDGNVKRALESVIDLPPGSCGLVKMAFCTFYVGAFTRMLLSLSSVFACPSNRSTEDQFTFEGVDPEYLEERAARKKNGGILPPAANKAIGWKEDNNKLSPHSREHGEYVAGSQEEEETNDMERSLQQDAGNISD